MSASAAAPCTRENRYPQPAAHLAANNLIFVLCLRGPTDNRQSLQRRLILQTAPGSGLAISFTSLTPKDFVPWY
ncbi:hypothetical protein J6590_105298 [Homalodisca vitripennis]|nr:hypothetical protein J6590_105298 [Homalodisca vitripennis]